MNGRYSTTAQFREIDSVCDYGPVRDNSAALTMQWKIFQAMTWKAKTQLNTHHNPATYERSNGRNKASHPRRPKSKCGTARYPNTSTSQSQSHFARRPKAVSAGEADNDARNLACRNKHRPLHHLHVSPFVKIRRTSGSRQSGVWLMTV